MSSEGLAIIRAVMSKKAWPRWSGSLSPKAGFPAWRLRNSPTITSPVLIQTMERHIRERQQAGVTFLIVEHDMSFVMRLCDPVIVLEAGRPIFTGPPEQAQANPAVLDAYLGS